MLLAISCINIWPKTIFWRLNCLHHQGQFDISVCTSQSTNSAPLTHPVSSQLQGGVKLVTSPTFCLISWNNLKKKPYLQINAHVVLCDIAMACP